MTIMPEQKSTEDDQPECIYLDYNGTTPVYPHVLESMMPWLTKHYGNPNSSHAMGGPPRQAIHQARKDVLHLLVPESSITDDLTSSIWFTACGTESDNMAIELALQCHECTSKGSVSDELPHIVTSNVEHAAIDLYLQVLEDAGKCTVTRVPVETDGRVDAVKVQAAIEEHKDLTVLVTLMLANNETGALQPVKAVSEYCRQNNILFHTDAAQAAGKVSVQLEDMGDPDMVSLVGHKLGAPKGIACLYVRPGSLDQGEDQCGRPRQMHSHGVLLIGGGQEFGRRGGTQNVASIVAMGVAAKGAQAKLPQNAQHMEGLRSRMLENLQKALGGPDQVRANGPAEAKDRLPNTLSVGLKGVNSGALLNTVGDRVAASAGATCHSTGQVSAVLRAMSVPDEFARGTLRLSVGPCTTEQEIDRATTILAEAAKKKLGK